MIEWSKDHVAAVGFLNSTIWFNWWNMGKLETERGALGGKWRQLVGKVEEWYVANWHLQDCSPRLYWLRTDGLAPASKYWTYGSHVGDMDPVSPVVGYQQKLDFFPLHHWLLWERSWVWTRGSVSQRAVDYVGSTSSRVQWICSNLLTILWKIAICGPHEICIVLNHTWTERGKRVAC
jgi:hypothetical protein